MKDFCKFAKKIRIRAGGRPLTKGEVEMARLVFKDSVDYARVKVHKRGYLPFGIQSDRMCIAPNGNLYFKPAMFRDDFSREQDTSKIWIIHEIAHVWQWQLGFRIKVHGVWAAITGRYFGGRFYSYDPETDSGKTLSDFNFEQQAQIISHYFGAEYLKDSLISPRLPFFRHVLEKFKINPGDKRLLPNRG